MKRVQMSVYVTPEIAERLKNSSEVASVPVGRHVGDMLESLIDSVEYVSGKMAEARLTPSYALDRLKALDTAVATEEKEVRGRVARVRARAAGTHTGRAA